MNPPAPPHETLSRWRERGQPAIAPPRLRFLEAMARRASLHDGQARRLLDARLAQLLAEHDAPASAAHAADTADTANAADDEHGAAAATAVAPVAPPAPGALAELVAHIGRSAASRPAEPEALAYFRATWSRLSAERRLTESLSEMPENVGPLNSHHLAHRALVLMRDLSPQYLSHFLSYVDALLWLEQAQAVSGASKSDGGRKGARAAAGPK